MSTDEHATQVAGGMSKTKKLLLRHRARLRGGAGRLRRRLRDKGAQKRKLQGDRQLSPRKVVRHRRPARVRQGRSVPAARDHHHDRDHGVRRAAHAAAPRAPAGRRRGGLRADETGDGRQHGREAGQEMVPGHLHVVHLHPRLEPDRLHPAAGRLPEHVQAVRRAHPVLSDLCRGDEPRGPARARARRVRRLQRRRGAGPRSRRVHKEPDPEGRRRADADPDLPAGDALQLRPAAALAHDQALG